MRTIAAVLLGVFLVIPYPALPDAPIYLIRHAEKGDGDDPPLTTFGRQRAALWAEMLSEAELALVVSSTAARTRETAALIAEALVLPHEEFPAQDTASVIDLIGFDYEGEAILVVAHTETLGALMRGLGASETPEVSQENFDRLFVLWPDSGEIVELRMPSVGTAR